MWSRSLGVECAPFIAPRGLGVVAFSTRKLKNFPVCGLTRQFGAPLESRLPTIARRSDWAVSFSGVTLDSPVIGQLPHQLVVGGWRPLVDRAVGVHVWCTGQCVVYCMLNFIIKIPEDSVFVRTSHRTYSPNSLVGLRLKLLQLLFTLLERFCGT